MTTLDDVAVMLKQARAGRGISRPIAARESGVGEATIKVAERSGATSARTLCALANAYGYRIELVPLHGPQSDDAAAVTVNAKAKGRPLSASNGGTAPTSGG